MMPGHYESKDVLKHVYIKIDSTLWVTDEWDGTPVTKRVPRGAFLHMGNANPVKVGA
jgi:hypothetical protein